jgi:hypothetical protein
MKKERYGSAQDIPGKTVDDILEDAIRRRDKVNSLAARHDKIISELAVMNEDWWLNFPTAHRLMTLHRKLIVSASEDECQNFIRQILTIERETVATYVVPIVYACVRAGFYPKGD